jgi:hypothetical protein
MGKTSVLRKLAAEGRPGYLPIMRSVQDVNAPEELVRHLLSDVKQHCPGVLRGSIGKRLSKLGVRTVGISPVSVEFEPKKPDGWKDVLRDTFAALSENQDERVVLLWDELPHMIGNISAAGGVFAAREVLDLLRAQREEHAPIRMVFSGSLGLHHVLKGMRTPRAAWQPVNDMLLVDLPPLTHDDASFLATELLRNEDVACDARATVASTIATQVNAVPYYVHLTVQALGERAADVTAADVEPLVDERLRDPLDSWQLLHYVDRLADYYGSEAPVVKALLDAVAVADAPLAVNDLSQRIAAVTPPPPRDRLVELLDLLGKDHYLGSGADGSVTFRLELIRRAWRARRRL